MNEIPKTPILTNSTLTVKATAELNRKILAELEEDDDTEKTVEELLNDQEEKRN